MKYIEPKTRKPKKYIPPPSKPRKDHFWIRLILGLGTLLIFYILSQYIK